MKYTIIITHADGTNTTHAVQADNASTAHKQAEEMLTHTSKGFDEQAAMQRHLDSMRRQQAERPTKTRAKRIEGVQSRLDEMKKEVASIRTYATIADSAEGEINVDELQAGALTIVKRTTANMICREGGDIQYRLYNECRKPHIDDPDVDDMLSVAMLALIEAVREGEPIDEQYHRAYLAVNKHLRASKQINLSATAMRTVYIEDINGEIISVNGEINRILAPDERYTPDIDDTTSPEITNAQRQAIKAITATLTPTQINILRYMAKGYSLRQIAEKTKRTAPTIQVHINKIREKARTLYPEGYKSIIA